MYESRMYGNVMRNSIVCLIGIEKLFESIVHETLSKHICTYDTYSHYELKHYTKKQRNGEREKKKHTIFPNMLPLGPTVRRSYCSQDDRKKKNQQKKLFLCVLETKMELNWKIAVI